jgi:hypothetical protein
VGKEGKRADAGWGRRRSDGMSASVTAADAAACSSRSFEVQVLAGRVEACAAQLEDVL